MQRKQSEKSLDSVEAFFISENFLIQLLISANLLAPGKKHCSISS